MHNVIASELFSEFIEHQPALKSIRKGLELTGFSEPVYLVGGAPRDLLLGQTPGKDLDLVSTGDVLTLAEKLWELRIADEPPVLYKNFGTTMLRIDDFHLELIRARKESYRVGSRKPETEPASIEEDALRRDFTVNTLLVDIRTAKLNDPLGLGLRDFGKRTLRTPREPELTFEEDPLRMLRGVRFRSQIGFKYAPGLPEAMQAKAETLETLSAERIQEEFVKMLRLPNPSPALNDLLDFGLLAVFAPELARMKGTEQGHYHHLDVWDHTLLVVSLVPAENLTLRLAALLHDIGKPDTYQMDAEGRIRFLQHELVGEKIARDLLNRLKFPHRQVDTVCKLVRGHMRLGSAPVFTDTAARRLIRDMGDDLGDLFDLVEADTKALKPGVKPMDIRPIREQVEKIQSELGDQKIASPLDGTEIQELFNLSGKQIGEAKRYLEEQLIRGALTAGDKEKARLLLASYLERSSSGNESNSEP
ncbi:MAG: CCA tRNA nucleotidyltransferase [Fimbriimonadaceae bacterium]